MSERERGRTKEREREREDFKELIWECRVDGGRHGGYAVAVNGNDEPWPPEESIEMWKNSGKSPALTTHSCPSTRTQCYWLFPPSLSPSLHLTLSGTNLD